MSSRPKRAPRPTRDNPPVKRFVLFHPGRGSGWTTQLGDEFKTRTRRVIMLEFRPFVDRLLAGKKLRYNPEGLASLRRLPVPKDEAAALERWLDVDIAAQRDPAVRAFLVEWKRSFPGEQQPYMDAVEHLAVMELPAHVQLVVIACEGSEQVVREDELVEKWRWL